MYLDELDLSVVIDTHYDFSGEVREWLAAYEGSESFEDREIVIAINYDGLYRQMLQSGITDSVYNIEAQAFITIAHEVGHAIIDYLGSDLGKIDDEERMVEDFGLASCPQITGVWSSELGYRISEFLEDDDE